MTTDPRVDAYIAEARPFAQPILVHLRRVMHASGPDLGEDIKWRMPFFTLAGRPLAHMAAFKQHCVFGFWRGRTAADPGHDGEAMGQFGRILTLADLPDEAALTALIRRLTEPSRVAAASKPAPKPKPKAVSVPRG